MDVFEFKEEEQPSEFEANRFCRNHTFSKNGARGTNENSNRTSNEPSVDNEAADGDFNGNSSSLDADDLTHERILSSGNIATIGSINQRHYPDRDPTNQWGGCLLEGSSASTRTDFPNILRGSPSNDESVDTASDIGESISEESASYSSATPENPDVLEGPLSDRNFVHWRMFENKPIVFCPDYLNIGGASDSVTDSTVTFSSNFVEIKGSNTDTGPFSISFGVEDILEIQSQLSAQFDVAMFKIHINRSAIAQAENPQQTSGTEEVEFSVNDFDLSEKCEAIESLDGYKAVWNSPYGIEEWRTKSHGETSHQQSKKYFASYGGLHDEVIYPKGDPDAVCISKRDFDLLEPDTFVNDTIIDFYVKYLKNKIPVEKRQRYHFFNSFFFRKLADMDKDPTSAFDGHAAFLRVRKWTRKVDFFGKDFVFIPVNYNYHWSLIVICHPGEVANVTDDDAAALSTLKVPCILHMDSLKGSHSCLKDLMQSYLWEEWKERTKDTSEVVSSKFRNLRFLSLELPQQQNLSDCGLFLLHYVELFLEEDPAGISPYRIKKYHNEFLSINWFQPHEPSIKRAEIQKLISNLLQNLSLEKSPSASENSYPEDGVKTSNDDENAVELVSEQFCSSNIPDNLPCSQVNEITSFPSSSLKDVCASNSGLALCEPVDPESDEDQLLDMRFGHSASFNVFRSSLPPIQEEVEAGVLMYTSAETGLQHLDGNGTEPCAFSYSSGSLTAGTWIPGVSVVQAVEDELDPIPATTVSDAENPLEVAMGERCEGDANKNSDEKNDLKFESITTQYSLVDGKATSDELLDITLAQCSVETHDNIDTGPATFGQENLLNIHENGNIAFKSLLLIGSDSGTEEDPQPHAKRMRLTPIDEDKVALRSSLSHDLHL